MAAVTRTTTFAGANVYLSRSLVPPEFFDALRDALKINGAHVFLCSDPSRNSPSDYHVISSMDHEKFEDLRSKGCNLLGPHCVLSCAKEHRVLPKQGYTCCLAMDGVKVLASGFEKDEKVRIQKLVTAMGGILETRASLDVNFVIVKTVLASKYKCALNVLKKPIVNLSWLSQCWTEHRVVPHDRFRVLPFSGLTVCVTRIPAEERKEMEKLIILNGGLYSPNLTKKCTHLISDAAVGDKYLVARRWGNIHIVTRKWIDQSIAKGGCLHEGSYPVEGVPKSCNTMKGLQKEHFHQEFSNASSQHVRSTAGDDLEATVSQSITSPVSVGNGINNEVFAPSELMKEEASNVNPVAEDSEMEYDDLYLSDCRISLVGFEEKQQSRLVYMIRKGGGTRHMLPSEKLTHIILGVPSETEKREIRRLASFGVINVVRATWLEECDQAKRELPVLPRHIVSELLSKDLTSPCIGLSADANGIKTAKSFPSVPRVGTRQVSEDKSIPADFVLQKRRMMGNSGIGVNNKSSDELASRSAHLTELRPAIDENKDCHKLEYTSGPIMSVHPSKSSSTFKDKIFYFSSLFPLDQRPEVIDWIKQGGGLLVDDERKMDADFVVERHGLLQSPDALYKCTAVSISTHWIRSSLEEGSMQDVADHILYSPLRCHIPLRGFEGLRFCISQYEEKDRILLRNLCFVLGAKFTEKLTKKVTHLLCKFKNGPKYEAACKWGIQSVTAEWITECITKDAMVLPDSFQPRPVIAQDREAGLCIVSQYPTQAVRMVSGCVPSQLPTQSQGPVYRPKETSQGTMEIIENSSAYGKRLRLPESSSDDSSKKTKAGDEVRESSDLVPDVADIIEDLLAQSNKIQDKKLPETSGCDQSIFSSDHSSLLGQNHSSSHSNFGIPRHWPNRTQKQDPVSDPPSHEGKAAAFYAFSETQTDSQVVSYEEDLSGRQKIIDRVRSQSQSRTLTPDK